MRSPVSLVSCRLVGCQNLRLSDGCDQDPDQDQHLRRCGVFLGKTMDTKEPQGTPTGVYSIIYGGYNLTGIYTSDISNNGTLSIMLFLVVYP